MLGGISLNFILTKPFPCYLSLSVWCVCVCVLFIYTIIYTMSKVPAKTHIMGQTSLNLMLECIKQGPSGTKVPKRDMCRSIISLSKVTTHQM